MVLELLYKNKLVKLYLQLVESNTELMKYICSIDYEDWRSHNFVANLHYYCNKWVVIYGYNGDREFFDTMAEALLFKVSSVLSDKLCIDTNTVYNDLSIK